MYISSSCEYLSSLNPIASIKSTSKAPSSVTHTPINARKHSECLPAAADHLLLQNQIGGTSHPVCRLPPADGLTLAQSPRPGHNRMIRPTSWKEGLQCSCQVCLRAFVFTDVFSWVRSLSQNVSVHSPSSSQSSSSDWMLIVDHGYQGQQNQLLLLKENPVLHLKADRAGRK